MTTNPYRSPEEGCPTDLVAAETPATLGEIARSVFLAWEWLRIPYVVVLVALTCLVAGTKLMEPRVFWLALEGAVAANVLYFAAPVTETYIRWLGHHGKWVRWVLFGGGLVVSIVLAAGVLATELLPNAP